MKKLLVVLFLSSLWLVACTTHKDPGMEGYVVKIENGRILVVASKPKDFSSTGGLAEFYNAIWFSNAPEKVKVGDKVQVWFDVVAESYPGQSEAEKVEILAEKKPRNANLTKAEVIRKALAPEQINKHEIPAIKSILYNQKADIWEVLVKQGDTEVNIVIKDK
jgi:Protein of unknown function (DUF3221)